LLRRDRCVTVRLRWSSRPHARARARRATGRHCCGAARRGGWSSSRPKAASRLPQPPMLPASVLPASRLLRPAVTAHCTTFVSGLPVVLVAGVVGPRALTLLESSSSRDASPSLRVTRAVCSAQVVLDGEAGTANFRSAVRPGASHEAAALPARPISSASNTLLPPLPPPRQAATGRFERVGGSAVPGPRDRAGVV
jgi:hypothetical protein